MRALQLIYSFFLGLVVVGFVWIGLDTFYPRPEYPGNGFDRPPDPAAESAYRLATERWNLTTSIILLVVATVILLIAVLGAAGMAVLSNGLLLGGVFTMLYAVGQSVSSEQSVARFVVITLALLVTIGVGWLKFVRRSSGTPDEPGSPEVVPTGSGDDSRADEGIAARLQALEKRMESLRRALGE
jgi:hypothetical protein